VLTGLRSELVEHFASHREIGGLLAAGVSDDERRALELGSAENLKRVRLLEADAWEDARWEGPRAFDGLIEIKTIWHPVSS
ncbi:MAG: hypothetical protein AAGK04_09465, partial [Planctomycetota bacterium]